MFRKSDKTADAEKDLPLTLAKWLRDQRSSKLKTYDSILNPAGKRVDSFSTDDLLAVIANADTSKHAWLEEVVSLSKSELMKMLNLMIQRKFFVVTKVVKPPTIKRGEKQDAVVVLSDSQEFAEKVVLTWILEPSQTVLVAQSVSLIFFIIAVCCFKIWPLWLKIAVWWCSVVLLVLMITAMILHLISGVVFILLGFQNMYFLPNLFDPDLPFFYTFSPTFGSGGEHQQRWKLEREAQKAAKIQRQISASGSSSSSSSSSSPAAVSVNLDVPKVELPSQGFFSSWRLGVLNIAFLVCVALGICVYMGVFKPENVPDFVVSTNELISMFPSLAPPDWVGDTVKEAAKAAEDAARAAAAEEDLDYQ